MDYTKTIAESNNFIVLDKYTKKLKLLRVIKAKVNWSGN